jgi:manganese/zinc/iron transport system permease protein
VAGVTGVLCTLAIDRWTRIKDDAAMAIVLSIFFGLGIALFTVIQNMPTGQAAGLHHFIFGKAASMVYDDVVLIAGAAGVVLAVCCLLFKEFSLLCFDEEFGAAQGRPMLGLDLALMGLVVGVTVIGLQSVGLLLVVGLLIIPAAAARFWTDNLSTMALVSAVLGGGSAFLGVLASALFPRLAAGAVIVLVGSALFVISLVLGAQRGVLRRVLIHRKVQRQIGQHDLLRAAYECLERLAADDGLPVTRHTVKFEQLAAHRSWSRSRVRGLLSAAIRRDLVTQVGSDSYRLTQTGAAEAEKLVRNHRLWELYLINYADVSPSHVDRDADLIEHVLGPELVQELEAELRQRSSVRGMPPSPHLIEEPVSAHT